MKLSLITVLLLLMVASLNLQSQSFKDIARQHPNNFDSIVKVAENYFASKYKSNNGKPTYRSKIYNVDTGMARYNKIDGELAKYKRWEWYWQSRVLSDGSFPDVTAINTKIKHQRNIQKRANEPKWTSINQTTCTGGYNGMGRTKAIAFHPTNPDIFYVGAPIGGVWKTVDGGLSYVPISDQLPYVSAGTVVVDYENPQTLYITVSDNGGWWNYSLGVWKSTDDGATWNPTSLEYTFNNEVALYRMIMSPEDHNTLFVAGSNGIWRTKNGGETWTRVKSEAHNSIEFKPGNANTLYACSDDYYGSSEIFKSTNGGDSWTQITNFGVRYNNLKIAVTPANPEMIAVRHSVDKLFYVSKNGGNNFTQKTNVAEDMVLFISHVNEDIIYNAYVNPYRSNDGGNTWNQIAMWYGGTQYPEVHADAQYMAYNPLNGLTYFCNDGGIYSYNERTQQWRELSNGLIITQYYCIATAQTDATYMIGGTQDNGGRKRNTDGSWSSTNGGDAMEVAIDPTNHNISYSTYCYGELFRTTNNWRSYSEISLNIPGQPDGDWVTPYQLDPNNPNVIVGGYDEIYRSTDRGDNWTKISSFNVGNIQTLCIAPSNSNVIYASRENRIYRTENLGSSWTTLNGPGSNKITDIAINPENHMEIWVSYSAYTSGRKVYHSSNGGANWENVSDGLPNVPANVIVYEEGSDDLLYVGTDAGVYFKDNSMSSWHLHGEGLPFTSVTDLEIQYQSGKLRAGTHGRGIWEINLRNIVPNIPPQITLTSPSPNEALEGSLTISAEASDEDGEITKVDFFVNGNLAGTAETPPYEITVSGLEAGNVVILARAYDDNFGDAETNPIQITVPCKSDIEGTGTIIGTEGSWSNRGDDKYKVFDGDITTFFDAPEGGTGWVGLDFEQEKQITAVRFYPRASSSNRMNDGYFQVSNSEDFSDATTIYTIKGISQDRWYCIYFNFENTSRYIRYHSPEGGYCNIAEMEVFVAENFIPLPELNGEGLHATYFTDTAFQQVHTYMIDSIINFSETIQNHVPNLTDAYSVLWQGMLTSPIGGDVYFTLNTKGKTKVWLGNEKIFDLTSGEQTQYANLIANTPTPIRIEHSTESSNLDISLSWRHEDYEDVTITKSFYSPIISQEIKLIPGWNLISLYIESEQKLVDSVFGGIPVSVIKSENDVYYSNMPNSLNSLDSLKAGIGYAIYLDSESDTTISVTGSVYEFESLSLSEGWNLTGIGSFPLNIDNLNQSIESIKNQDSFWDGTPQSTLQRLEPGKAYYVKVH